MTERPALTQQDVRRLLQEFLTTSEPPTPEEIETWLVERGFETGVADPLMHMITMSSTVMLTAHIMTEFSDDENIAMPSPPFVTALAEVAAAVGITFLLIGWDLAVQSGATR